MPVDATPLGHRASGPAGWILARLLVGASLLRSEVSAVGLMDAKEGSLPFYIRAESIVLMADGTKGAPEADAETERNMRRAIPRRRREPGRGPYILLVISDTGALQQEVVTGGTGTNHVSVVVQVVD